VESCIAIRAGICTGSRKRFSLSRSVRIRPCVLGSAEPVGASVGW
jgi:hypothetical protein